MSWQQTREEIRDIVQAVARNGDTITYGDLAARLQTASFHPRSAVYHRLLREICLEEEATGRGFLCALVVKKDTGLPGSGYFRFMAQRGEDVSHPAQFWRQHVQQIYNYWQSQPENMS